MATINSISTAIDLDDVSIDTVPGLIDSAVDRLVADLLTVPALARGNAPGFRVRIISTHLVPVNCHYSVPEGGGSFRDYHYNERGLVLTIVYEVI